MSNHFIKISATGEQLPREAAEWDAVLDTRTNLIWSVKTKKVSNWKNADAAAKAITVAGVDGRLPTVEELFLLADRTKFRPAIDTEFFPDCPSDWFWSSTVNAEAPSVYAWGAFFDNGGSVFGDHNFNGGFVRAVRVSQ